jgi:hypothetical protein
LKNYSQNYNKPNSSSEVRFRCDKNKESILKKLREKNATIATSTPNASDLISDLNNGSYTSILPIDLRKELPMLPKEWNDVMNGIQQNTIALVQIKKNDVDFFASDINFPPKYQQEIKNSLNSNWGILISDSNNRYKYLCCIKEQ